MRNALFTRQYCVYLISPLTTELNPTAQRCLRRIFTGDFGFKMLTARRLCKSFGVKGLMVRRLVYTGHTMQEINDWGTKGNETPWKAFQ
jgi:hypothetical protein